MCMDDLYHVCGELVHVFQRHDLKRHQTFLILSGRKKGQSKEQKLTPQQQESARTGMVVAGTNTNGTSSKSTYLNIAIHKREQNTCSLECNERMSKDHNEVDILREAY